MEGAWSGEATGEESGYVSLDLNQDGEEVTGSGELRESAGSGGQGLTFSIQGGSVREDGSVTLPAFIDAGGVREQLRFTGEVSGDEMDLTATGSEGEIPVALERGEG